MARYTYRVAIANSRLLDLKDNQVRFRYKDRKNNQLKQTTISAVEFIRRFLLHTLPKGFFRIRHYGFLANRDHTANLNLIRRLLNRIHHLPKANTSLEQMMLILTGIDITKCPCCKKGKMHTVAEIPKSGGKHPNNFIRPPNYQTTAAG
jgi:hypothetical protein